MAGIALKSLADGRLSSTVTNLFSVNSDEDVELHQVILVNATANNRTVNVYISFRQPNGSQGSNRLITPYNLILDGGDLCYVMDEPIQLNPGDILRGVADVAATVEYIITGLSHGR